MTPRPCKIALSLALALSPAGGSRAFADGARNTPERKSSGQQPAEQMTAERKSSGQQPSAQKPPGEKATGRKSGGGKPGEKKGGGAPACDQQRALALVEQQAEEARSFAPSASQITVMIRAADLLWPYRQEQARATFAEAFDLAVEHFRQRGDETVREGRAGRMQLPDQRFEVMKAVAKRDAAWARRLAEQTAEESKRDAAARAQSAEGRGVGEKLINLATAMLEVDGAAALGLARGSFRQPASLFLPRFFYELAKRDQRAADELFLEAVAAYSAAGTTHDLAYLSVYPFALKSTLAAVKSSTAYEPPPGFKESAAAQEAFLRAVLARAEVVSRTPDQFSTDANPYYWETAQLVSAIAALEPLAAARLPAYAERVAEMRARVEAAGGERARAGAHSYLANQRRAEESQDFAAQADKAEAQTDPDRRDQAVTFLALGARTLEDFARLESLAEKVSDANVRRQLLDWLNFNRSIRLSKDGLFDESKRAADRVGELDLRSVLYFEIGRESLKRLADKARARELLDEVAAAAAKSPNTAVKARAQLGVVHLLSGFDGLRALEVANDAVKTVNALDNPDLARGFVARRIEGKTFSTFGGFAVPGFSLETAFRELGPHDFEGALMAARNLSDRALRATAVVGLAAHCLEQPAPPVDEKRPAVGAKP